MAWRPAIFGMRWDRSAVVLRVEGDLLRRIVSSVATKSLLLSVFSGSLLILSFPNFDLGVLAWVALVPLLLAIEGKGPLQAYALGCSAGVAFVLGMSYWIWTVPTFKLLAGVLAGFYIAQHVAVWGLGVCWIRRRMALPLALVAPCVWVAVEYLRSHVGFLSLPWLLLGQSLGVTPTPMGMPEVYLALQTGAIDGQENPPTIFNAAKFYEVTKQMVITSHLVQPVFYAIAKPYWDKLSPEQRSKLQAAATQAAKWNDEQRLADEKTVIDGLAVKGLTVTRPDLGAFRANADKVYATADAAKAWDRKMMDEVMAVK